MTARDLGIALWDIYYCVERNVLRREFNYYGGQFFFFLYSVGANFCDCERLVF